MRALKHGKNRKLRGFSLVEVLSYVVILSIISGVVASLVIQIYRYQTIVQDRTQLNDDLRVLMKSIRDDMYLGDDLLVDVSGDLYITSTFNSPNQVRYYIQSDQVYRQADGGASVSVTNVDTNVTQFEFQDISTPSSAGVIRVTIGMRNYPRGPLKPLVEEQVTSTISLKFL